MLRCRCRCYRCTAAAAPLLLQRHFVRVIEQHFDISFCEVFEMQINSW
jgi:hypothetical protein